MATIQASEALKSRARAIRDELATMLGVALAKSIKRQRPDPAANLAASLLVATWETAFNEAYRTFVQSRNIARANAAFLAIVDQGTRGVEAAVKGSRCV